MSDYDVFLSYRVDTDAGNAKVLFMELRVDYAKNTKVFLDNVALELGKDWKEQFLEALKHSRVCVPIISNKFMNGLDVEENKVDNVLLEWDTILDRVENGSGQLIVPLFVQDETGDLSFGNADLKMKDVRAKGCKRTARQIWDSLKCKHGKMINLTDSNSVKLFVREIQE
ncbi:hypothetical protein HK098_005620, partial [Nowakowskiella sp. JEL0407]